MGHPVPAGYHTLTPHLVVAGAAEAIEFYKRAFGAEERGRMGMPGPDGRERIAHAELAIGNSVLFLADAFPEYGSSGPDGKPLPMVVHVYVTDANAAFQRAVDAGATVSMPLSDMFWGDRYGQVMDPFGHRWSIAEHLEDLTPEQMDERRKAFFAGGCGE